MITEEIKKAAQTVGLDLVKLGGKSDGEITSGYMHLELLKEENEKFIEESQTINKSRYIQTGFREFCQGVYRTDRHWG